MFISSYNSTNPHVSYLQVCRAHITNKTSSTGVSNNSNTFLALLAFSAPPIQNGDFVAATDVVVTGVAMACLPVIGIRKSVCEARVYGGKVFG